MATITSKGTGYLVQGANRIVANFVITVAEPPGGPAGSNPFVYSITFPRNMATPPKKMMVAQCSRDVGGTTSVGVSTTADVAVPLGVFLGRDVAYSVTDDAQGKRTLQVTISSRDTMGTDEVWRQELQITKPAGGMTTYDIAIVSGTGAITSVEVTP